MAKYIVFDFVGTGTLYLVPETEQHELDVIYQQMQEEPGRMAQIGTFESSLPVAYQWWRVSTRPVEDNRPRIAGIKRRNADYL